MDINVSHRKTVAENLKQFPSVFWWVILFILIAIVIVQYRALTGSKNRETQKTAVMIAHATTMDIPIYLNALGSITPTYSVTVKTQINGQLLTVLFREGQLVKKGQLLAEIDSRPYLAQLLQYEGQLTRDRALLVNANIDLKRYQTLWKQDSVAQQILATQESLVKQLEGTIKIDEGLLAATKVNLAYCKIISPVDGRIGLRAVDPGNVVQTSDVSGIAVINTLNPITAIFSIPEDHIPEVMQKLGLGETLTTEAFDREQNKLLVKGALLTVDNQIDPTTGTVRLKAQFNNDRDILFPSQFVNIRLLVKTISNAIVVPTAAIQNSTVGTFVYILNRDSTVSIKPVKIGVTLQDKTTILSGILKGEAVVIAGVDKLTDGAAVTLISNNKTSVKQTYKKGHTSA